MVKLINSFLKKVFITNQDEYLVGIQGVNQFLPEHLRELYSDYYFKGSGGIILLFLFIVVMMMAAFGSKAERYISKAILILAGMFWIKDVVITIRHTSFPISYLGLPIPNISLKAVSFIIFSLTFYISWRAKNMIEKQLSPQAKKIMNVSLVLVMIVLFLPLLTGELWISN